MALFLSIWFRILNWSIIFHFQWFVRWFFFQLLFIYANFCFFIELVWNWLQLNICFKFFWKGIFIVNFLTFPKIYISLVSNLIVLIFEFLFMKHSPLFFLFSYWIPLYVFILIWPFFWSFRSQWNCIIDWSIFMWE